jgi:hypothetical protein
MPTAYGKWETAYKRYRLWCTTGLWPRILAELGPPESYVSLWGRFLRQAADVVEQPLCDVTLVWKGSRL